MVKTLHTMMAIGKLIRLPNLIILGLTQGMIRYFIIRPLLEIKGLSLQMSFFNFILLVAASMLVTAGGYIINDYFDRRIDTVNSPDEVVVGREISLRQTMALHITITTIGVLLGLYVAWAVDFFYLGFLFILGSGILWFYSTTYKRQVLIGNLIVAIMTGMIPLLVLLFEVPVLYKSYIHLILKEDLNLIYLFRWVGCFSGFAFMLTLAREIVKDAEDIRGDGTYSRQTLPLIAGMAISKVIVIAIYALTALSLLLIYFFYLPDPYTLAYIIVFLLLPLIVAIILTARAKSPGHFRSVSILTKIIMVAGLCYAFVANYLIHHLK